MSIDGDDVFVGRQPILDREGNTFGYELLFRSGYNPNAAIFDSGATATATVINNSLMNMGLENLVGKTRAFINFPEAFFLNITEPCFSNDQIVIEVLEDIPATADVIESLSRLREKGFLLALDDFVYRKRLVPFIMAADIIKFDIEHVNPKNLKPLFDKIKDISNVKILAERVETKEMYQACLDAGADYFQGFYFAKPEIVAGKQMSVSRQHLMLLMSKISDEKINLDDLQEIIERDVGLSHKIMRMAQHYRTVGIPEFSCIKEVMMLFGLGRVQSWATLLTMCAIDDIHPEVFKLALVRAIFMRKVAAEQNLPNIESFYLEGLFSLLDTILHEDMTETLDSLPISVQIKKGIIDGSGEYGKLLQLAKNYETGSEGQNQDLNYGSLYLTSVEEAAKVFDFV